MNSPNTSGEPIPRHQSEILEALIDGREPPRHDARPPERLLMICRHAQKNCARPVTLEEVSHLVGLHPHHVSTIFRDGMGIGYRTFLSKCRVRRSCELLKSRTIPMSQVARTAGFRSVSQFNRSFMQHMKLTPSAFRKKSNPSSSRAIP